jgi:uncharacterized membrane protein
MYKINWKNESPMIGLIGAIFIASLFLYPRLPEQIPMHWNMRGRVDSYAAKTLLTTMVIPLLTLGLYVITLLLPFIDPRKERYIQFEKAYRISRCSLVAFLAIVWGIVMSASLGLKVPVGKILPGCVAVLLIVLGNYMGKVRRNWFFGIRLPWTLSDEDNWNKTHRLGGKLFVASGIISLIGCVLPSQWTFGILISAISLTTIAVIGFSYSLFFRKARKNSAK